MSRKTNRAGRRRPEITYDQAVAELPAAEAAARAESSVYEQAYAECVSLLHRMHAIMAQERARAISARRRWDRMRAIVDAGDGKVVKEFDFVDNPMITQGLLDAVASGEVATKHEAQVLAAKNMALLIGGLARVETKTEAQVLAAIRFCNLYERAQIGAGRATDYSQVRVDTSGPAQDPLVGGQDSARRAYADAAGALERSGQGRSRIVEQVVVYGLSMRGLARMLGMDEGGKSREVATAELLKAIDVLVDHFGLLPEDGRHRHWSDGSRSMDVRVGTQEIAHKRTGRGPKSPLVA